MMKVKSIGEPGIVFDLVVPFARMFCAQAAGVVAKKLNRTRMVDLMLDFMPCYQWSIYGLIVVYTQFRADMAIAFFDFLRLWEV